MAAKVWMTPAEVAEPSFIGFADAYVNGGFDVEAYNRVCQDHQERLADWCRKTLRAEGKQRINKLVGKVIRWQVADGYAEYMVMNTSPLELIHLSYGDGYQVNPIMLRGLRLSDVKEMVERDERIRELFANKVAS